MSETGRTIRLKVSPEVARVVAPQSPRELKLQAARGALPLSGRDLVTALFFLCHGGDAELRGQALQTLGRLPAPVLLPVVSDVETHPQLLDFIARRRLDDLAVMEPLLINPALPDATLAFAAGHAAGHVLSLVANNDRRLRRAPSIVEALLANPHADRAMKYRLGWSGPEDEAESAVAEAEPVEVPDGQAEAEDEEPGEIEEELNQSKYQQALELGVAEKIKIALTGDKEWRSIFLKDSNKLVSSAALKNPRITDGEVLAVARNKSTNDELIRLITLNKEWVKNPEIKKALIMHPKTPLPKALRFMNVLGEKDLKMLAKSRNVSQVLVNNARRMLMAKEKKR